MIRSLLFAAVLAALAISTQVRLPLSILFVGDEAALAKVSPLDETNSSSDVASVGRERSGDGYPLIRPLLVLLQPAVIWRQAARSTPCFDGWYSLSSSQVHHLVRVLYTSHAQGPHLLIPLFVTSPSTNSILPYKHRLSSPPLSAGQPSQPPLLSMLAVSMPSKRSASVTGRTCVNSRREESVVPARRR